MSAHNPRRPRSKGLLGFIEWLGNKLPDPVFLFVGATVLVMLLSAVGAGMGWSVQPQRVRAVTESVTAADGSVVQTPKLDAGGRPLTELVPSGAPVTPRNLLSVEGVYWLLANVVRNFINFAPLGVVLVGMFGIGVAEKVGLFGAAMRWAAAIVPSKALTPTIVFLGVVSNIASDAGYIILPPLAAALYAAFGRPPLVGIAAAFAGVSAGFSANILVGLDRRACRGHHHARRAHAGADLFGLGHRQLVVPDCFHVRTHSGRMGRDSLDRRAPPRCAGP
jgi:aminobenzoyl-glutamate transport protein